MNIIDVVILLLLGMFAVVGLKRGFFKQTVMTVGTLLVVFLAFAFKNPIADWLCLHLPFFRFGGAFQDLVVLNVILYQLLAFLLLLIVFFAILSILIRVSGILEKVLKFTIILGIPSKILGFLVGLIEGYVVIFVALFFLQQPTLNLEIFQESKLTPKILNSTPGLSLIVQDMNQTVQDIYHLKDQFGDGKDSNQFNLETLDVMLKHRIINVTSIEQLKENGKLDSITGIDSVLNRYR